MIESIEELRKICQDVGERDLLPRPERRVSIYLTKLLLYTPITANQVTLIDFVVGLVGCAFLFSGDYGHSLVGAVFLELFVFLDFVDGEIARYRKSTTLFSSFIEFFPHPIIEPLTFLGLGFSLSESSRSPELILLGFAAALAIVLIPLTDMQREKVLASHDVGRSLRIVRTSVEEQVKRYLRHGRHLTNTAAFMLQTTGIYPTILVSTLADYVLICLLSLNTSFLLYQVSLRYIVLFFYGVSLPVLWIANLIVSMKTVKSSGIREKE